MASNLVSRANHALDLNGNTVNGRTADIAITTHGSDLYFAICAAMGFAGFAFVGLAMRKHRRDRLFHYITAAVVFVACIAYFTMGSNLGFTPIQVEFPRNDPVVRGQYREIFYVRYIDWVITTPLLLLDLLLTAGMPWPTILWTLLIDEIMIITGLVGALIVSRYKWAYFTFGCIALFYIVYVLAFEARKHSAHYGAEVKKAFLYCGSLTTFLWILYPIAWGLCEGGNVISPDSEAIFYGILDFLAKPCFGALLIWGHRNIDPASIGMAIRDYEDDTMVRREKAGVPTNSNIQAPLDGPAATNGHQV
ncbi:ion channel activity protein [Didymella heteroderae]|uniref:Ion channel activity protein n=1 Tax=Didymella heteroderae TaxID=1769908 RepID=A0A9P5C416_9PLEO|nr:ion channel activity protein [Didymella heteroderae]